MRTLNTMIALLFLSACQTTTGTVNIKADKQIGIQPNTLKQIKVVDNWEPVADVDILKSYMGKSYNMKTYSIEYVQKKNINCIDKYQNVPKLKNTRDNKSANAWFKCHQWFHAKSSENPQILGDMLLHWANNPEQMNIRRGDLLMQGYQLPSTMGTFATLYSIWYNDITFTTEQRNKVDTYLTNWLMKYNRPVIDPGERKCSINNYRSTLDGNVDSNTCGNKAIRMAVGSVMFGLRTENQKLLDHGHDHLYVIWSQIDPEGIWVNNASRGNQFFNYLMDNVGHFSFLAEVYHNLGYDLFEHTLPHGAKVKDVLAWNYALLSDFKMASKYAKYNVGSMWTTWDKVKNLSQAQFIQLDNATNSYRYSDGYKQWNSIHARYMARYKSNVYVEIKYYKGNAITMNSANPVSYSGMYYGNGSESVVISSITQQLQSQ